MFLTLGIYDTEIKIFLNDLQIWDMVIKQRCHGPDHVQTMTNVKQVKKQQIETEQGLTSHQTHYGSYLGRVFTGQMTQPTASKH